MMDRRLGRGEQSAEFVRNRLAMQDEHKRQNKKVLTPHAESTNTILYQGRGWMYGR